MWPHWLPPWRPIRRAWMSWPVCMPRARSARGSGSRPVTRSPRASPTIAARSRRRLTPRAVYELAGTGGALRKQWPGLDLGRQQAILKAVLDHAVIAPAAPGAAVSTSIVCNRIGASSHNGRVCIRAALMVCSDVAADCWCSGFPGGLRVCVWSGERSRPEAACGRTKVRALTAHHPRHRDAPLSPRGKVVLERISRCPIDR